MDKNHNYSVKDVYGQTAQFNFLNDRPLYKQSFSPQGWIISDIHKPNKVAWLIWLLLAWLQCIIYDTLVFLWPQNSKYNYLQKLWSTALPVETCTLLHNTVSRSTNNQFFNQRWLLFLQSTVDSNTTQKTKWNTMNLNF